MQHLEEYGPALHINTDRLAVNELANRAVMAVVKAERHGFYVKLQAGLQIVCEFAEFDSLQPTSDSFQRASRSKLAAVAAQCRTGGPKFLQTLILVAKKYERYSQQRAALPRFSL